MYTFSEFQRHTQKRLKLLFSLRHSFLLAGCMCQVTTMNLSYHLQINGTDLELAVPLLQSVVMAYLYRIFGYTCLKSRFLALL